MNSNIVRYAKPVVVSLVLLALVIWSASGQEIDFSTVRPILLVPTVAAYLVVLILRASLLKLLAPVQKGISFRNWLALAARHQIVFILAPSGSGDLAFPLLASRIVGLKPKVSIPLIAEMRVRDICTVLALGCAGLVVTGRIPVVGIVGTVIFAGALYWSDTSITLAKAVLRRLGLKKLQVTETPKIVEKGINTPLRLLTAIVTLLMWLVASSGIVFAFNASGFSINPFESWIMLAGLNLAGAVAMSFAGLGVAEAGATGVLVFLGVSFSSAAAIAIIARPLLLLSNIVACGIIEVLMWFVVASR